MNFIKHITVFNKSVNGYMYRKMSTSEKYLDIAFQNSIKTITLHHPKTRNSLSLAMMENIIEELTNQKNDSNLRVIIISSIGPIFSAGHNLKELGPNYSREQHEKVFQLSTKLMTEIIDHPVPIIARVDGLAAASGCQLVAQCDLAYCTEKSTFSTPGVNFGIFCSTPGIPLSRKLNKSTALYMLFTGQPITSHVAKQNGLINKVCTPETLDSEIDNVCQFIKQKSRPVVELGKKFFYKQIQNDLKTAYNLGANIMVENVNLQDGKEGILSFIEKRKPNWNN